MYSLIVRPRAEKQTADYYLWYESKRIGLGEEFLLSIDACLNHIERYPLSFQKKYEEVRVGLVDRFPFGIFYFVDDKKIIVIAVFYLGQDPGLFKKLGKEK